MIGKSASSVCLSLFISLCLRRLSSVLHQLSAGTKTLFAQICQTPTTPSASCSFDRQPSVSEGRFVLVSRALPRSPPQPRTGALRDTFQSDLWPGLSDAQKKTRRHLSPHQWESVFTFQSEAQMFLYSVFFSAVLTHST